MADKGSFVRIPQKMYAAILTYGFTSTQILVVLYVLRKTYGWGKTKDVIAISKIARDTNKKRQLISRTVSDLQKMNVLGVERDRSNVRPMMWVEDPENWDKGATVEFHATFGFMQLKVAGGETVQFQGGETQELQEGATVEFHTIEHKEPITKEPYIKEDPSGSSDDEEWLDPEEAWRRWKEKNGTV